MAIPIFWRLMAGYSVILVLSLGASSYSILRLGTLSEAARTALGRDYRLISHQERLADIFLSEVRYAGKFVITQAAAHRDQFSQFNRDFLRSLSEVKALAASPEVEGRLARVEEYHRRYRELFEQEVRYLKARQPYAESRYRQEKEKIMDTLLRELEGLKGRLQETFQEKLRTIEGAAHTARSVAILTTVLLIALGAAVSLVVSRSITRPISELRQQTAENAPDTASAEDFSRIPEIRDLADALAHARRKLEAAAQANRDFVRSVTDEFATPLISMRARLGRLESELNATMTTDQKAVLQILASENDRLIRRFQQLAEAPPVPEALPGGSEEKPERRAAAAMTTTRRALLENWRSRAFRLAELWHRRARASWSSIRASIETLGCGKARKS
ncbi:MAG TPA: hypothetical protein VNN77_16690 [candidate division Zixibacteria bacterium]|nr:hypothetical protein [candidate division Zixibacteria bacterium]